MSLRREALLRVQRQRQFDCRLSGPQNRVVVGGCFSVTSVSHFSKSFAAQFGERACDVRRRIMRQRGVAAALASGSPMRDETAETAIVAQIGQEDPNC